MGSDVSTPECKSCDEQGYILQSECPKCKSCDEQGYIKSEACPKCKSCDEQGYILPSACPGCKAEQDEIKSLKTELTNARTVFDYYNRFLDQPGIDIGKFKDWRGKWFLIYNNAENMKRHVSIDGKDGKTSKIVLREQINPVLDYFTVDYVGRLLWSTSLDVMIYAPNWNNGGALYVAACSNHEPVDCAGQWKLYDDGRIGPRNGTNKFWDISGRSKAPEGSDILIWGKSEGTDQQWTLKEVQLEPTPAETFSLHNESNVLNKVIIALIVLAVLFVCVMTWMKMRRANEEVNVSSFPDSSD